jgi:DhnA family fructose-bisphosphate aldolase class Ia
MLPLGYGGEPDVEQLAIAARIGAEMGADIIKTKYLGPPAAYRQVTEACFAPVLVLGGSQRDLSSVTATIADALEAGVAGVAMGRNVWRSGDVRATIGTIVDAVRPRSQGGGV